MLILKVARLGVRFASDDRLFHNVAPLYEKLFCPIEDTFSGNLMSIAAVHLRLYDEVVEFVTNSRRDIVDQSYSLI